MMLLYEHIGKVEDMDKFDNAIAKIKQGLQGTINEVYPMYKLFYEMPQGNKHFIDWYPEVREQAC